MCGRTTAGFDPGWLHVENSLRAGGFSRQGTAVHRCAKPNSIVAAMKAAVIARGRLEGIYER
ncbi:MAG: hypothetical protein JWN81_1398 [Solirubrobacterales bacterium]|nr:hypothetical protein [Solirubrobacterales bacterium]